MNAMLTRLRRTSESKVILLPRLLAGLPLLGFGAMHFMKPDHFRDILTAAGAPMVDANVIAGSALELLGGVLILSGLLARVGGLLGIATMVPAILTTIKFMSMAEHPFVPPLPLPIVVLLASVAVTILGAGPFSADRAATAACDPPPC